MQWWYFIGLVGLTLIISRGGIFKATREYLVGFKRWYNPLRMAGEIMHCPMCSGFWVGLAGALVLGFGLIHAVVIGGCTSLASWVSGCLAVWLEWRSGFGEDDQIPEEKVPQDPLEGIRQLRLALDHYRGRVEEMEAEKEEI